MLYWIVQRLLTWKLAGHTGELTVPRESLRYTNLWYNGFALYNVLKFVIGHWSLSTSIIHILACGPGYWDAFPWDRVLMNTPVKSYSLWNREPWQRLHCSRQSIEWDLISRVCMHLKPAEHFTLQDWPAPRAHGFVPRNDLHPCAA